MHITKKMTVNYINFKRGYFCKWFEHWQWLESESISCFPYRLFLSWRIKQGWKTDWQAISSACESKPRKTSQTVHEIHCHHKNLQWTTASVMKKTTQKLTMCFQITHTANQSQRMEATDWWWPEGAEQGGRWKLSPQQVYLSISAPVAETEIRGRVTVSDRAEHQDCQAQQSAATHPSATVSFGFLIFGTTLF